MAHSELTNPFEGLGTYVFGERFVGRPEHIQWLQDNCTSRNISIQGLPKIGKTSLVFHSLIHQRDQVKAKQSYCPVFFNVGTCRTPEDFFKRLVVAVKENLLSALPEERKATVQQLYALVKEEEFDLGYVESFFENGVKNLPVDVVIVFDEFDKVQDIKFAGHDFGLLRAILSVPNIHGTITSKQSIYSLENWEHDETAGPSTFYQLFQGNTLHLVQYTDNDMVSYWKRLEPYFEAIGLSLDDDYRQTALYYAGHHPHLLDVYNAHIFDNYVNSGEMPDIVSVRTTMKAAFDSQLSILRREKLLNPAIQIILSPVYDLKEDEFNRLKEYDFLRKVKAAEKQSLLASDYGYHLQMNDDPKDVFSFLAPTDYFSLLFRQYYDSPQGFWAEWSITFASMRQLAEKFFKENWGENWEESTDGFPLIQELASMRKRYMSKGLPCGPLIGFMSESHLRQLFRQNWATFEPVFSDFGKQGFFERYEFILNNRNIHAHNNPVFPTQEDRDKANRYLRELKKAIDKGMKLSFRLPYPGEKTAAAHPAESRFPGPGRKNKPFKRTTFVKKPDSPVIDLKDGMKKEGTVVPTDPGFPEGKRVQCGLPFTLSIDPSCFDQVKVGDRVRFTLKAFPKTPNRFFAAELELTE